MSNVRIATRYAKSLLGLAIERNELDKAFADMEWLQSVCKSNPDFVNMLRSPVIKSDAKGKIVMAVAKDNIGQLTASFIQLLITKGREGGLPEISTEFIRQYKEYKKIRIVKVTTAVPLSDELKEGIVRFIKSTTDIQNLELETIVNKDIIGGIIMQAGDKLVDASVAYDFKQIGKLFENNDFIYKVR
ncbi:MAG: ATP synthase F1 subunit delta [Bacteroidetes bacterium]|nr:MAG: ATP synthase F1 subunit delta [Bacteroidota bacterium]